MVDIIDKLKNGITDEKKGVICVGFIGMLIILVILGAFISNGSSSTSVSTPPTLVPTQKDATPAPSNNYMRGDVISAYEDSNIMSYGWVISKYDSQNDLYYGYRAEFINGEWRQSETDEYDLWSKKETKDMFPYVLGHINLKS